MEHPTRPIADEAALEQAVRQYQAELLRYAAGILGNAADAEDAVQTAFLKLWHSRGRLRPDTNLRALLYRITCNTALDMLRRARREAARTPPAAPPETDGPETADRRAALRAALDALRPRTGRWYGARWWRACPTGSWRPSTTGRSRTCATGAAAPNACWPTC